MKELVTDLILILILKKKMEILKPIDLLIVKYQSDSVSIYKVLPNFNVLLVHFKELYTNKVITLAERKYLCNILGY